MGEDFVKGIGENFVKRMVENFVKRMGEKDGCKSVGEKRWVKKVWVKTFCYKFVKCMSEKRWVKSMGENFIPYSRLPISKASAAACQSLPMAISGSRFCAVFCQWHIYCGKLGQEAAQS